MGEWIDVPAHRIYSCNLDEFEKRFARFGEDGQVCRQPFEKVVMLVREDGKRFRHAKFLPTAEAGYNDPKDFRVYLEEI